MGLVNRVVPEAELESYVKNVTDMICANAPLTIKAAKFAIDASLEDKSRARRGARRSIGRRLLRQRRLYRGPHRLHGKAQAGVYREVTQRADTIREHFHVPDSSRC